MYFSKYRCDHPIFGIIKVLFWIGIVQEIIHCITFCGAWLSDDALLCRWFKTETQRTNSQPLGWMFDIRAPTRQGSLDIKISCQTSGPHLNIKTVFPGIMISILKVRRPWDRLIHNMGIPILVRSHLYIETPPPESLESSRAVFVFASF